MKNFINRIKTLYWFWKLSGKWKYNSHWVLEHGRLPDFPYPNLLWAEMYGEGGDYWTLNKGLKE
jgi:hypothetical protein